MSEIAPSPHYTFVERTDYRLAAGAIMLKGLCLLSRDWHIPKISLKSRNPDDFLKK
jgi:hypothetical protein